MRASGLFLFLFPVPVSVSVSVSVPVPVSVPVLVSVSVPDSLSHHVSASVIAASKLVEFCAFVAAHKSLPTNAVFSGLALAAAPLAGLGLKYGLVHTWRSCLVVHLCLSSVKLTKVTTDGTWGTVLGMSDAVQVPRDVTPASFIAALAAAEGALGAVWADTALLHVVVLGCHLCEYHKVKNKVSGCFSDACNFLPTWLLGNTYNTYSTCKMCNACSTCNTCSARDACNSDLTTRLLLGIYVSTLLFCPSSNSGA